MSDIKEMNFNDVTGEMLKVISDYDPVTGFKGAYNIREDSYCAGRKSSDNITIESKKDKPGIDIKVKPNTVGETVFIPACVTHSDVDDLVYNDFFIGEGADVVVVAGCGVHSDGEETARHNGIHRFFLEKGAHVVYKEKHIGTGKGKGLKKIDPVTDCFLKEDACLEMDTIQLGGVDRSTRTTSAVLEKGAKIIVRERIMTDNEEEAITKFDVKLNGEDSGADLVSRSVARGSSHQAFYSVVEGNNRCTGHSACDAILAENGRVDAQPALNASNVDAALIHEAAIGKIAGEQLMKLCSLGLTREQAEEKIIEGFLK
ncbi:MAG: SufB/SufD family protein [Oscillospiraceae bacterium]